MALVKVEYNGDLRVLEIPETNVESLKCKVFTAYCFPDSKWSDFALKYKDGDGDYISIISDADFRLALRLNSAPLRLYIYESNNLRETETELMKEFRASKLAGSYVDFLLERYGIELSLPQFETVLETLNISINDASSVLGQENHQRQAVIPLRMLHCSLVDVSNTLTQRGVPLDLSRLQLLLDALRVGFPALEGNQRVPPSNQITHRNDTYSSENHLENTTWKSQQDGSQWSMPRMLSSPSLSAPTSSCFGSAPTETWQTNPVSTPSTPQSLGQLGVGDWVDFVPRGLKQSHAGLLTKSLSAGNLSTGPKGLAQSEGRPRSPHHHYTHSSPMPWSSTVGPQPPQPSQPTTEEDLHRQGPGAPAYVFPAPPPPPPPFAVGNHTFRVPGGMYNMAQPPRHQPGPRRQPLLSQPQSQRHQQEWHPIAAYLQDPGYANGPGAMGAHSSTSLGGASGSRPKGGKRRLMARFVAHVTVPDRSVLKGNQCFVKTWRLRNDSNEPWPTPAALALVGGNGEEMRSPEATNLEGGLLPGWEREISIQLMTPEKPGLYEAFWRLREESGRKFGQRLWCIIQVAESGDSPLIEDVVNSVVW